MPSRFDDPDETAGPDTTRMNLFGGATRWVASPSVRLGPAPVRRCAPGTLQRHDSDKMKGYDSDKIKGK